MPTKKKTTKTKTASTPKPKTTKKTSKPSVAIKPDEKYMIEQDLQTLQRAKEIVADKKRLAKCQRLANEQIKALKTVTK